MSSHVLLQMAPHTHPFFPLHCCREQKAFKEQWIVPVTVRVLSVHAQPGEDSFKIWNRDVTQVGGYDHACVCVCVCVCCSIFPSYLREPLFFLCDRVVLGVVPAQIFIQHCCGLASLGVQYMCVCSLLLALVSECSLPGSCIANLHLSVLYLCSICSVSVLSALCLFTLCFSLLLFLSPWLSQVSLVGAVMTVTGGQTNTRYQIDDGTGQIEVVMYKTTNQNEAFPRQERQIV